MNVATIEPLDYTIYRHSPFLGINNINGNNLVPEDEYSYIKADGSTFFSRKIDNFLYLENKTIAMKMIYDDYDQNGKRRLESICKNEIIQKIEDLISLLIIEGCKHIYLTPTLKNIKVEVKEESLNYAITAKLKVLIFGKKDQSIFIEAFSL